MYFMLIMGLWVPFNVALSDDIFMKTNAFKAALAKNEPQIGLWVGTANAYTTEICASTGYDWVLIDGEHAPTNPLLVLAQLQALAAYPEVAPVLRPAWNDPVLFKQLLDIGAQNFLVPMIQNADEARAAARALRYPPEGQRGVGTALARAAQWGGRPDYLQQANEQICLLCQVETMQGIEALDEILQVDGVDGVFIGPADLAASMGYITDPAHPEVVETIEAAIQRIVAAGKAAGILQTHVESAKRYLALGASFVAVGVDTLLLKRGAENLLAEFKEGRTINTPQAGQAY